MIAWVDLETTGLEPTLDDIIEVGITVTENDLTFVANKSFIIRPGRNTLGLFSKFTGDMHEKSGLLPLLKGTADRVYPFDPPIVSLSLAERQLCSFMDAHGVTGTPMAGSSVAFDRAFLNRHMPFLALKFHYRNMDVSAVREFAKLWWNNHDEHLANWLKEHPVNVLHRVEPDLFDSISLARFYMEHLFWSPYLQES